MDHLHHNQPVDLIIPAFNEEENIYALSAAIPRHHFRHIYLIDNASTDNTSKLAKEAGFIVLHEPNRGYGSACLRGLHHIERHGKVNDPAPPFAVAFLDADLSDDPHHLYNVMTPILEHEADMVIASRIKLAEPGSLSPQQRFGNWLSCKLLKITTKHAYSDLGPMRAIRYDSLEKIHMQDKTWGWTVEMQFKAAAADYIQIKEVDVPYRNRQAGQSKISGSLVGSAKAGYKILATIWKLYWQQKRNPQIETIN